VEPVKHQRRRETRYDITERLFRIWRQTATVTGHQRFKLLTQFLKIYYTPEEMGGAGRDVFHPRGDLLWLSGRFEEAREALERGLAVTPGDWDLSVAREIVRACQGEHGPHMEGLATALLSIKVPADRRSAMVQFLLDVAGKCMLRGDRARASDLLDAALSLPWREEEWWGAVLGIFLGKLLDGPPLAFEMALDQIQEKRVEPKLLALLNPYFQAAVYHQTGDVSILDCLFPEVRELVLEIAQRLQNILPTSISNRS
jgi:hypothetical protein